MTVASIEQSITEAFYVSYVEKAFYMYLRSTLTAGIKVLLSRRFIFFTMVILLTAVLSTAASWLATTEPVFIGFRSSDVLNIVYSAEIGIAISFIVLGLFAKRIRSNMIRIPTVLGLSLIFVAFIIVTQQLPNIPPEANAVFVDIFPVLAFLAWCIMVPIAAYGFAKGLLANKVNGSLLFMGKPKDDPRAVFSLIFDLIFLITLGIGIYLSYQGFWQVGPLLIVMSLLMILITHGYLVKNDVFNTTMAFYFALMFPNIIPMVMTSANVATNVAGTLDFLLVLFSLVYTAQNISKKIDISKLESSEEVVVIDFEKTPKAPKKPQKDVKSQQLDDPFYISRIVRKIGGEGLVFIFLGILLGFHITQLRVITGSGIIFPEIFGNLDVGQAYRVLTLWVASLSVIISIISFLTWQRFRDYFQADIYRFEFLPPFEVLVDNLERLKSGEIDKKTLALNVMKFGVKTAARGARSAAVTGSSTVNSMIQRLASLISAEDEKSSKK